MIAVHKDKEEFFEEFFIYISSILEDLCQSGFHTVHDATLQDLKEKGELASQCGMQHLSELLLTLQNELSQSRHSISNDKHADSLCAGYYTELVKYIETGKKRTAYDKGKNYYLKSSKIAITI